MLHESDGTLPSGSMQQLCMLSDPREREREKDDILPPFLRTFHSASLTAL